MGRKRLPTALRVIQGNRGKRPLPENEPKPRIARPAPPEHLGEIAKAEWHRVADELYALGILTQIDRASLAAYCQVWERWVTAEKLIRQAAEENPLSAGLTLVTTNGNHMPNPMVHVANKAMHDIVKYASEFGMTPSARSRIAAHRLAESQEDSAEKFFG